MRESKRERGNWAWIDADHMADSRIVVGRAHEIRIEGKRMVEMED